MCVYCFVADWMFKYSPYLPDPNQPIIQPISIPVQPWTPWTPYPAPMPISTPAPLPALPGTTWTRQQLDEALEILRKVKEMEDALGGCPCEDPKKMDFLHDIKARLDRLEEAQKASTDEESTAEPASDSNSVSY